MKLLKLFADQPILLLQIPLLIVFGVCYAIVYLLVRFWPLRWY